MTYQINIITLFPQMFPGPLAESITGRALQKNIWNIHTTDIRTFGSGKHRTVDAPPYGGGNGMVMRPDVVYAAIKATPIIGSFIYLDPIGKPFHQNIAHEFAQQEGITLLCGHYEGIDARLFDEIKVTRISVGDFVVTGGEIATFSILDSIIRLLPGVLGAAKSLEDESFQNYRLDYPCYTKPAEWKGHEVPTVLRSGHHKNIQIWRQEQSLVRTKQYRPDLLEKK